jgi:hypothetical protein
MPTLADVPALVDTVRRHGLAVTLSAAENPEAAAPPFPLVLETSAYRVVQEALTNVTRHAAATRAWVEIEHRRGELVVTVRDDGGGQPTVSGPGLGLTGSEQLAETIVVIWGMPPMSQRVAAVRRPPSRSGRARWIGPRGARTSQRVWQV